MRPFVTLNETQGRKTIVLGVCSDAEIVRVVAERVLHQLEGKEAAVRLLVAPATGEATPHGT